MTSEIQTLSITEGHIATIRISASELNRLISPFTVTSTYTKQPFEITIDGKQVYLSANTVQAGEIYLTTEPGLVYSLRLIADPHLLAQTIRLKPIDLPTRAATSAYLKAEDYPAAIATLIKQAYWGNPDGLTVRTVNRPLPSYRELTLTHAETWIGPHLSVDVLIGVSTMDTPLRLDETTWVHPSVKAVAIERPNLAPKQQTRIWIIRSTDSTDSTDQTVKDTRDVSPESP